MKSAASKRPGTGEHSATMPQTGCGLITDACQMKATLPTLSLLSTIKFCPLSLPPSLESLQSPWRRNPLPLVRPPVRPFPKSFSESNRTASIARERDRQGGREATDSLTDASVASLLQFPPLSLSPLKLSRPWHLAGLRLGLALRLFLRWHG